jgi:ribonuclease P protein component
VYCLWGTGEYGLHKDHGSDKFVKFLYTASVISNDLRGYETYLQPEESPPKARSRLQATNEDQEWPYGIGSPPRKRQKEAQRLMPKKLIFLKTEEDFSNFRKSRSLISANFKMRWHVPHDQNHPRFGFIVPKKTLKNVTDRNLIKRRLKALISRYSDGIKPVDILFFPKPGTIKLKFPDLEKEFLDLLQKARIYDAPKAGK